jgi:hypothetical protein
MCDVSCRLRGEMEPSSQLDNGSASHYLSRPHSLGPENSHQRRPLIGPPSGAGPVVMLAAHPLPPGVYQVPAVEQPLPPAVYDEQSGKHWTFGRGGRSRSPSQFHSGGGIRRSSARPLGDAHRRAESQQAPAVGRGRCHGKLRSRTS